MGYITLETPNAKYHIELLSHYAIRPTVPNDIDAIAGEGMPNVPIGQGHPDESVGRQAESLKEIAKTRGIPRFKLDTVPHPARMVTGIGKAAVRNLGLSYAVLRILERAQKKLPNKLSRRQWIGEAGKTGIALAAMPVVLSSSMILPGEIQAREPLRKALSWQSRAWPNIFVEGRNAVIAEKLEAFIAPTLRQRLGRKPFIYVDLGALHLSVKEYLEDPRIRQKMLETFSPLRKFFDPKTVYRAGESRYNSRTKKWEYQIHEKALEEKEGKRAEFHAPAQTGHRQEKGNPSKQAKAGITRRAFLRGRRA